MWNGYLALGSTTGSGQFTEVIALGYLRQPVTMSDPMGGKCFGRGGPLKFTTSQQAPQSLNALAFYPLSVGSAPVFVYPLVQPVQFGLTAPRIINPENTLTIDFVDYRTGDQVPFYTDPTVVCSLPPVALSSQGGTMTGNLILAHDPTQPNEAATKNYVDVGDTAGKTYTNTTAVLLTQKAVANGVATLDANAKLPANQLPAAATGTLNYRGAWNPVTNTPVLATGGLVGGVATTKGDYYVVSTSGTSTAIDGLTTWLAGDWASSTGSKWEKLAYSSTYGTMAPQNANAVAITGGTIAGITNLVATGGALSGLTTLGASAANITGGTISGLTTLGASAANITGGTITGLTTLGASAAAITGGTIVGLTNLVATGGSLTNLTALSSSNATITGGNIVGLTSLTATSGSLSGLTALGASNVTLTSGTITGITNLVATGGALSGLTNLVATGGSLTGLTTLASTNATITGGTLTGITNLVATGGALTGITNLVATGGALTGLTSLGASNVNITSGTITGLSNFSATSGSLSGLSSVGAGTLALAAPGTITGVASQTFTTGANFLANNILSPDYVSTVQDPSGNIISAYSQDGTFNTCATVINGSLSAGATTTTTLNATAITATSVATPALTGINALTLTNVTATNSATLATEVIAEQPLLPDMTGLVIGTNGNVVSGYDIVSGEFNASSINTPILKINGAPFSTSAVAVLPDSIDVRDPAYGAKGDGQFTYGRVTCSGNSIKVVNFHGNVNITVIDANTVRLNIGSQVRDGWAFQPRHDNKLVYVASDDGQFTMLGTVKSHCYGTDVIVTAPGVGAQTNITASVTCPAFDPAMVTAGASKYICIDGLGRETWWTYSLSTGAPQTRQVDAGSTYGVQTFISSIATVVSGNSITIQNVVSATPNNGTVPFSWTDVPSRVQWGSNDVGPVARAAKAAFDAGKRMIKFTGDGSHYLLLGMCGSGGWGSHWLAATTEDTAPLLNGIIWIADNATTWACTDNGMEYPHRAAPTYAPQPRPANKLISGKQHLRRCSQIPLDQPINVVISGDSLGSINPQSQVATVMGVCRFQEEFSRQNPGRKINYYCVGIGGATWASLADPGLACNNTTPAVIYGTMPKPLGTGTSGWPATIPHRNFYFNVNQTVTRDSAPIYPDVVAMFLNAGNDAMCVDAMSMHAILNVIRSAPHPNDSYGPTDIIMQTDWLLVNQVWNQGTSLSTALPDPHAKVWGHDFATNLNRTTSVVRGFGLVDYHEQLAKVCFGNDLTHRALRQIPSVTWNLAAGSSLSLGPRCRDFTLWFSSNAATDQTWWQALVQLEFQLSWHHGNRVMLRYGPNGNIWCCQTTNGHFVDTVVQTTAGNTTLTVAAPTSHTITGLLTGKQTQLFVQSGLTFDTSYEGKCFVVPGGNLTSGVAGRRPMRTYFRRMMDANNMLVFDRDFDGGDADLTNATMTHGGQHFIPQDGEAMTDVSIIYPDGTLFTSNVTFGGYVSQTQVTLADAAPQTLSGTASMYLGRMGQRWFDTGITPSTTANTGMFLLEVIRGSLAFGYNPNVPLMSIVPPQVFKPIERYGGEFNCIVRAKGSANVICNNMWIDDDAPSRMTVTPWDCRGVIDSNSDWAQGGTAGHYGSRLRTEILDPLYANQNLSVI